MEKSRPGEDEIEIHFQHENHSPAPRQGQREGAHLHVITVTGENRTLSGKEREVRSS
jgi:hypothetical protein